MSDRKALIERPAMRPDLRAALVSTLATLAMALLMGSALSLADRHYERADLAGQEHFVGYRTAGVE